MPLTVQKLQLRIAELGRVAFGPGIAVSPIFVSPASEPMAPPPAIDSELWRQLEVGQTWGNEYGTSWLRASPQLLQLEGGQWVLHLHWNTRHRNALSPWDTGPNDALLLQLEATVLLDGSAIGGFDSRHSRLVLPAESYDGQHHNLAIRVYTRVPTPFGGLTMHARHERMWKLYQLMHTLLEVHLALDEHAIAHHTLLEHLNTAYTMLDLREGWQSERLGESASKALNYLQAYVNDGLSTNTRPHIVVSGHAHLDLGWLWPYWRTRQKIAHTISNVLGLMERYPQYYYSQSQPQLLEWLKQDAPDMYARLKDRVREGRIELVGAMWVEADCNLTSGESLIRQILHGTRFIQQEFGFTTRLLWLPDAFGYNAALPQILRGSNIPVFMTTKLSWNQFNRMPCDTFRWRGIDGSEVLTHFITAPDAHEEARYHTYNGPLRPADITGTWKNYRQQSINNQLLYLCGWGDGGGGPTEDQLEQIQIMAKLPDFPFVSMGSVTEYFTALYERVWDHPGLPIWVGELYLEYHRGTYTSHARIKQANRRTELFYREAELLNAWASIYGMPSRHDLLNDGWRRILLNQFHDVLPGSSIHEVYDDAERLYREAYSIAERVRYEALSTLTSHIAGEDGTDILLNTLPWERSDPIQLQGDDAWNIEGAQQATDWEGNRILLVDGLRVPSCGALVVGNRVTGGIGLTKQACHAIYYETKRIVLSNEYYELSFDEHGEISCLYDRQVERDVLAPGQTGNQLIAFEDRPLNFDAWDIDLYYEEKPYPLSEASKIRIIEDGPVRATIEIVRHFLSSRITQWISLWRNSPRIDFATEIDWHEHQILLKAAFPVAINSSRATYEIQFGCVERPTHRNTSWDKARFEVYAHRWIDLSEGGYGVSLLNDSKYGCDIHDNAMRLTLLKSGVLPDPDADQGLHRFTYCLLPHVGDWREAQTVRRAYELNVPILCLMKEAHPSASIDGKGMMASSSFLSTDCPHIVVETVKPAEDGDGLIVRLYESHNWRGSGTVTFATDIAAAQECNCLEEAIGDVVYHGNQLHFQVRPFEIKSFRVHLAPAVRGAR